MVFSDDVVVIIHNICCGCVCFDKGDILMLREIRVVSSRGWPSGVVVKMMIFVMDNVVFVVVLVIVVVVDIVVDLSEAMVGFIW